MPFWAGVDPLKYIQEILIVAVAVVVLALLHVYWNRVIFLLTGDDRLHYSYLDVIYTGIFKCCGCCTGEWTRCISKCPCCPHRLRGKNLVKSLGQAIGWATYSVEIKNITCGDLPFDEGRGDFYLSVETSSNPPMVSALQEEKLPKVVHFPEIIGLKIRDSALEPRVGIIVKELNVVGSNNICNIHLSAGSIIDWACSPNPEDRVKRFCMRSNNADIERETPPWILLEFSEADDVRGVDSLPNHSEGGVMVRTWVPVDHQSVVASGAQPVANHNGARQGADMWKQAPRQNVDLQVSPFKHSYALLDDSGNPVAEPSEDSLKMIRYMRKTATCVFVLLQIAVFGGIFAYLFFRIYVWSCYRQFEWDTIAILRGAAIPVSEANLKVYKEDCHDRYDGTGLSHGATNGVDALADACRPNASTIIHYCENMPVGQPRPEAFTHLLFDWFGITLDHGMKCFEGVCQMRDNVARYDQEALFLGALLLLSTFVVKCMMNSCIKQVRKNHQSIASEEQKTRVGNRGATGAAGYGARGGSPNRTMY